MGQQGAPLRDESGAACQKKDPAGIGLPGYKDSAIGLRSLPRGFHDQDPAPDTAGRSAGPKQNILPQGPAGDFRFSLLLRQCPVEGRSAEYEPCKYRQLLKSGIESLSLSDGLSQVRTSGGERFLKA